MKEITKYTNKLRNKKVHRIDFNSLGELKKDCINANIHKSHMASYADWWGGDSINKLLDRCIAGDDRYTKQAEDLLEHLREEIEIPRPSWHASAWGALPNVPDFLCGEVDCMRMINYDNSQSAPIVVYFDPTSSAAISHSDLAKRGVAVLALCMALSQIRPLELRTFSDIDAFGDEHALITAKIQTNPLMISEAAFALCNPGYARGLTYCLANVRLGFEGMWGFGDHCEDYAQRVKIMSASLKANEQDIVIPGANKLDDLIKNPVAWVKREINRHVKILEEVY